MRFNSNWSHSWATSSVWNRERLVEVQVTDIGADGARRGDARLGVHVSSVHVYLSAGFVDDLAVLAYIALEHTVGAWVGQHKGA